MLNPVGNVVVDASKILKTVNIRSISDVGPITMSSDVNIGSFGTDAKTINTDHIRPLTTGARTDMGSTTISDLAAGTIAPSVGGMSINMNVPSATQITVDADLKATSFVTDTVNSATTGKMAVDLANSTITSPDGVTVSNITSQDTRFNSITSISKAFAINGDVKIMQDSTVYSDKLAANVAQNLTVNSDVLVNADNSLTASTINSIAINPAVSPYGLKLLLDQSTITADSNIIVTPNNLTQVYGNLQTDCIQPLTINGDINLVTASAANVLVGNLKAAKLIAYPGNNLQLVTDSGQFVKVPALRVDSISPSLDSNKYSFQH